MTCDETQDQHRRRACARCSRRAASLACGAGRGSQRCRSSNFTFVPQRITVKAGTTVTWINEDDIPHTVASSSKLFKSKALDTNDQILLHVHDTRNLRIFLLTASAHDGTVVVEAATGNAAAR